MFRAGSSCRLSVCSSLTQFTAVWFLSSLTACRHRSVFLLRFPSGLRTVKPLTSCYKQSDVGTQHVWTPDVTMAAPRGGEDVWGRRFWLVLLNSFKVCHVHRAPLLDWHVRNSPDHNLQSLVLLLTQNVLSPTWGQRRYRPSSTALFAEEPIISVSTRLSLLIIWSITLIGFHLMDQRKTVHGLINNINFNIKRQC